MGVVWAEPRPYSISEVKYLVNWSRHRDLYPSMPSTTFSQKCIDFGLIHLTHLWQCTTFFASCCVNFGHVLFSFETGFAWVQFPGAKLTPQLAKKVVHCQKWVRWISPKAMHFYENVVDGMDGYKSRCFDQLNNR